MDRRTISRALPCNSRAKWPNYVSPPGMLGSGEGVAGSGYGPTFFFQGLGGDQRDQQFGVFGGEWLIVHVLNFHVMGTSTTVWCVV